MKGSLTAWAELGLIIRACSGVTATPYTKHDASFCSAISCHGTACTGGTHYGNESATECRSLCDTVSCPCYDWRDGAISHLSPTQPNCRVSKSAGIAHSNDGYTAFTPPAPAPPSSLYDVKGSIEVDTNENTIFYWHDALYLLENIPCLSSLFIV